jgi:hypothetical protein
LKGYSLTDEKDIADSEKNHEMIGRKFKIRIIDYSVPSPKFSKQHESLHGLAEGAANFCRQSPKSKLLRRKKINSGAQKIGSRIIELIKIEFEFGQT